MGVIRDKKIIFELSNLDVKDSYTRRCWQSMVNNDLQIASYASFLNVSFQLFQPITLRGSGMVYIVNGALKEIIHNFHLEEA